MAKFREVADAMFEAMYGTKICSDNGELFSENYRWEFINMASDLGLYMDLMTRKYQIPLNKEEVAKQLLYFEHMHINNWHIIKDNLDMEKLKAVAAELLEERAYEKQETDTLERG